MASELVDKIDAFRKIAQLKLTKILDTIPGKKDFGVDSSLMKPLERFVGVAVLKSHGIEKIFKLGPSISPESPSVVFFLRSDIVTVKKVCDTIYASGGNKKYHLVLVPRSLYAIETLVEEEGLYGKIQFHSFSCDFIQIDTRILSLECPDAFKFFFAAKDRTHALPIASSLCSLQHIFGKIPLKMFIGQYSKSINSMMSVLNDTRGEPDSLLSDIGFLLVVDRDVDYASPLLTPGTYTSLVHDVLEINTGRVEIPRIENDEKKPVTMILTSEDETYNQIKHKHFSDAIMFLKQRISESHAEQAKRRNISLPEMREYVKNDLEKAANANKVLSNHLNICELITRQIGDKFEGIQNCQHNILIGLSRSDCITYIEESMASGANVPLVLRLICLFSLCQGDLTQYEAQSLRTQFFHAYGHEHLVTFHNLEKMGLFSVAAPAADVSGKLASKVAQAVSLPRRSGFQNAATKLKLFPDASEDYCVKDPKDSGYVFGGIYIPLIAQVVNILLKKEKIMRDVIKIIPGEVEVTGRSLDSIPEVSPQCIFVYVVGGITYAEIAALGLIERKTGCRIICAGTSIINGNILVQSAVS